VQRIPFIPSLGAAARSVASAHPLGSRILQCGLSRALPAANSRWSVRFIFALRRRSQAAFSPLVPLKSAATSHCVLCITAGAKRSIPARNPRVPGAFPQSRFTGSEP
jgi:hypothetical protein